MGKVIHWELHQKLKFDHTNKWYMNNLEVLPENETHNLLWDFEIQTDHEISARRTDLIIINKIHNFQNCGLCVLFSYQSANASSGIMRHYVVAFVCLDFALADNRMIKSFKELCITRVAAVIYIYIYIYI